MTSHLKLRYLRGLYLFLLFWGLIITRNAYAYLDPGSGSFFIQMLIAALTAIPFAFSGWLKKIFSFFKLTFKRNPKKKQ